MTSRPHLVFVADDYGLRASVQPILKLARRGQVDRVAVMTHYVSEEDAARLAATKVALDVHLELVSLLGRGTTEGEHALRRAWNFFYRYALGWVTRRKARREWKRQIERFQSLFGRLPDGLNSHEHIHFFPPLFGVVLELATEYSIPYVRYGKKGMLLTHHASFIGRVLEILVACDRLFIARRYPLIQTSDHLLSLDWLSDPHEVFAVLPSGSTEIVCHPERPEEFTTVGELRRL